MGVPARANHPLPGCKSARTRNRLLPTSGLCHNMSITALRSQVLIFHSDIQENWKVHFTLLLLLGCLIYYSVFFAFSVSSFILFLLYQGFESLLPLRSLQCLRSGIFIALLLVTPLGVFDVIALASFFGGMLLPVQRDR